MPAPFQTFPPDFALEPYTTRLGYAEGPDARVHAFGTLASVSSQSGYLTSHCGAFWQNLTPETLAVLSDDRATFRGLGTSARCVDCHTQDARLHDSDIAPPAVSQPEASAAAQALGPRDVLGEG